VRYELRAARMQMQRYAICAPPRRSRHSIQYT